MVVIACRFNRTEILTDGKDVFYTSLRGKKIYAGSLDFFVNKIFKIKG